MKSVKDMSVTELCEVYQTLSDKELKRELQPLIASKLATSDREYQELCEAMREPLRNNKNLKRKKKTKFRYYSR